MPVGGGDMGVGAPHGLGPAVQVVPHGPFLAGGLGVEVHQGQVEAAASAELEVWKDGGWAPLVQQSNKVSELEQSALATLSRIRYSPAEGNPDAIPVEVINRFEIEIN